MKKLYVIAVLALALLGTAALVLPLPEKLFNGWGIAPESQTPNIALVNSPPLASIPTPDGSRLLTLCGGNTLNVLNLTSLLPEPAVSAAPSHNGIAFSADGRLLFVGGGNGALVGNAAIQIFGYDPVTGSFSAKPAYLNPDFQYVTALAVHPTSGKLFVCLNFANEVAVMTVDSSDPDNPKLNLEKRIKVGADPLACCLSADGKYLFVADGGSKAVSAIDTASETLAGEFLVGVRPCAVAATADRVFITCSGDNRVYVGNVSDLVHNFSSLPSEVINTCIDPTNLEGSTPCAVSIDQAQNRLYVANADNDNIMVADISLPGKTAIKGWIPVGWHPTTVCALNNKLYVGIAKGIHSPTLSDGLSYFGYISVVDDLSDSHISQLTVESREAIPFWTRRILDPTAHVPGGPVPPPNTSMPVKVGDHSHIKHVVYVIMENMSYDQVLGDLQRMTPSGQVVVPPTPIGDGHPSLTTFGLNITPNRHLIANYYGVVDNLHCEGQASVEGHQWTDGAIATGAYENFYFDYWINEHEFKPTSGYIWEHARRQGLSVKVYGEAHHVIDSEDEASQDNDWGEFDSPRRDYQKIDDFISDLHRWERVVRLAHVDWMPSLCVLWLRDDHTFGNSPGLPTPNAAVAGNDFALGKLVEAISQSPYYWAGNGLDTALFAVEDDAQNGPDGTDPHRVYAQVVSRYSDPGVRHQAYTQSSILRTIELLLGLPPMTQYDAAAPPMYECFGSPGAMRYHALPPNVSITEVNPALNGAPLAVKHRKGAKFNFDDFEGEEMARYLWRYSKGPGVPYPTHVGH